MKLKVLVCNNHLGEYAGSELTALSIYNYFYQQGHNVTLTSLYSSNSQNSTYFYSITTLTSLNLEEFDLFWIQHNSCYDYIAQNIDLSTKTSFYYCQSPFEPLEALPKTLNQKTTVFFNSQETYLSQNTFLPSNILYPGPPSWEFQKRPLIVSNHLHPYLIQLLKECPGQIRHMGITGDYSLVTLEDLCAAAFVITIGKTAYFALSAGVPVVMFDKFSKIPILLTQENAHLHESTNFSGRSTLGFTEMPYEEFKKYIFELLPFKIPTSFMLKYCIDLQLRRNYGI